MFRVVTLQQGDSRDEEESVAAFPMEMNETQSVGRVERLR